MLPNGCLHFPNGNNFLVNPHYGWSYQVQVKLLGNTQNKDRYLLQLGLQGLETSTWDFSTLPGSRKPEGNSLVSFNGARLCLWIDT